MIILKEKISDSKLELSRDFLRKRYQGKQLGLEEEIVSDGTDFLGEVIRNDIREVVKR